MRVFNHPAPTLPAEASRDMLAFLEGYLASMAETGVALGPVGLAGIAEQINAHLKGTLERSVQEHARAARFSAAAAAVAAATRGEGD